MSISSKSIKSLSVGKVAGRYINFAYDCDHGSTKYLVATSAPDDHHLFNFDLEMVLMTDKPKTRLKSKKPQKAHLLVLDNYGDERIPDVIREEILSTTMFKETLGILRESGEIVRIGFIEEKVSHAGCPGSSSKLTCLAFNRFEPNLVVPAPYRERLDELKSKKRPYFLTLPEKLLFDLATHWASYNDLQRNICVDLDFHGQRLQVCGDSWQEVSGWQSY